MKRVSILIIGLVILSGWQVQAQDTDRIIQKGNESYKKKEFPMAEAAYNEVLTQDPNNNTAKYNKAAALYRQTKPDESIKVLDDLAFKTEATELRSKAYYNKGAILSSQKKLEESIDAYKNALRQDPADKEARENLQKALIELKKKNPPKKDDKKKQQQQKQQQKPQPKMNQKEAEQRLKLLEQKEKDVQERLQKEKSKTGGGQAKDW
jgi:Ca-activated chloride channel homolog